LDSARLLIFEPTHLFCTLVSSDVFDWTIWTEIISWSVSIFVL